jgi:hypothetical protein
VLLFLYWPISPKLETIILWVVFWVYSRRLIFKCRRFGTIYLFHLQRLDMKCRDDWKWGPVFIPGTRCKYRSPFPVISTLNIQPLKMEQIDGSETSAWKSQTPGIHPKDYSQFPLSIIRSFSLYTQQWYMSYRFADNLQAESGFSILILMTYTIATCTLKNSWTEELSETFRVPFQNKFDKLVHLVGWTMKNITRCTVTWTSNKYQYSVY